MKTLTIFLFFAFFASFSFSQSNGSTENPPFFAQCQLSNLSESELANLEVELRSNPYVRVVRVDIPTKRLFLLTQGLTSFNSTDFTSWMAGHAASYTCLQIGVHGVDEINPYPFTNCSEN